MGDVLTLTCEHSTVPDPGATVTWTRNGGSLTDGISTFSATKSLYTATKAATSDNGEYKCSVKFDTHGNKDSNVVTQYVRDVASPAPKAYAFTGAATFTLSCIFRGDALGATVWTKSGVSAELANGADYAVTAGTYTDYTRTDKLVIKTITSADAGTYKCEAAYSSGGDKKFVESVLAVTGNLHVLLVV